jgi:hypothetical protein
MMTATRCRISCSTSSELGELGVENPDEIAPAIERAEKATEEGRPALLEFITKEEFVFSRRASLKPPS